MQFSSLTRTRAKRIQVEAELQAIGLPQSWAPPEVQPARSQEPSRPLGTCLPGCGHCVNRFFLNNLTVFQCQCLLQGKLRLSYRILAFPMCLPYGKETSLMNSFCMPSADSILLIIKVHCIRAQKPKCLYLFCSVNHST